MGGGRGDGEGVVKTGRQDHGGVDGGSNQEGDDGMIGRMVLTQSTTKTIAHCGVDGGRGHPGNDQQRGSHDERSPSYRCRAEEVIGRR